MQNFLKPLSEKIWEELAENITVTLYLTNHCNYKCAHCLANAGPHKLKAYMTPEVLEQAANLIRHLEEKGKNRPNINLVGGEPTVDLEEFKRCLNTLNYKLGGNTQFEMTTNGWWTKNIHTTSTFLRTVDFFNGDIMIRISNSPFHQKFRPAWQNNMLTRFNNTDAYEIINTISEHSNLNYTCPNCGEPVKTPHQKECPHCQTNYEDYLPEEFMEERYLIEDVINRLETRKNNQGENTLYVDNQPGDNMRPLGRAAKNLITTITKPYCSAEAMSIHIAPNGTIVESGISIEDPETAIRTEYWINREFHKTHKQDKCRFCYAFSHKMGLKLKKYLQLEEQLKKAS